MNDETLISLAAKAADIHCRLAGGKHTTFYRFGWVEWNPLEKNDDAFSLMVRLGMEVFIDIHPDGCGCVEAYSMHLDPHMELRSIVNIEDDAEDDAEAATRRAVVLAAAALGANMDD